MHISINVYKWKEKSHVRFRFVKMHILLVQNVLLTGSLLIPITLDDNRKLSLLTNVMVFMVRQLADNA